MTTVPSNWMEVTPPQTMETVPQESQKSHTQSSRTHPRGSMPATWSEGQPATTAMQATATAKAPATPPWEFRPHQPLPDSQPLCPLPGFMEITQTLRKEEPMESSPPPVITGILTQEIVNPYEVMGMAVMVARLLQNQTAREMMVDIQVCSEGIMG